MMTSGISHELEDRIIRSVQRGTVEVPRGPFYDRNLKNALGIGGVHQSEVCRHVNHMVDAGLIALVDTGDRVYACMTDREKPYPVVRLELA